MILRFEVDQAEAFRRGVDVPKSTNHIDVDPSELPQEERNLIADRLDGIDLFPLVADSASEIRRFKGAGRIIAKLPTYEALIEAIRKNQIEVETTIAEFVSKAK